MASQPTGPETGIAYTLTNAEGHIAVFNDTASANYVGGLSGEDAITGLDSPEVRESMADLVEADGAIHGTFYHGRRPITISGQILGTSNTQRNERLTKLQRATNSLSADGTLSWTNTGSIKQFVNVRKQQPTRITGAGTLKTFFIALVAADPRIYSDALTSYTGIAAATNQSIENRGSYPAPFESITLKKPTGGTGQIDSIAVKLNGTSGPIVVQLDNLAWGSASTISTYVINTRLRTVTTTGTPAASAYSKVGFTTSTWTDIPAGTGTVRFEVTTSGGTPTGHTMDVSYRDVWA